MKRLFITLVLGLALTNVSAQTPDAKSGRIQKLFPHLVKSEQDEDKLFGEKRMAQILEQEKKHEMELQKHRMEMLGDMSSTSAMHNNAPLRISSNGKFTEKMDCVEGQWAKRIYYYMPDGSHVQDYYTKNESDWVLQNKWTIKVNDNGNVICEEGSQRNNGVLTPSYKYEYAYDSANRQTLNAYYNWVNGQWEGVRKYEYTYDDNGNQVFYAYYNSWQNGGWVGSNKYEKTYDSENRVTRTLYYSWNNEVESGEWYLEEDYKNTYFEDGRAYEEILYKLENGTVKPDRKYESENSNNWNYYKYACYNWADSVFVGDYKYETDSRSNPAVYTNYAWVGDAWTVDSISETTYDDRYNVLEVKGYHVSDGVRTLTLDTDLSVDPTTYVLTYYVYCDGSRRPSYRESQHYNDLGQLVQYEYYTYNDSTFVILNRRCYDYDLNNRQTLYERFAWRDGEFRCVNKTETAYNDNGYETMRAYYSYDGAALVGNDKYVNDYDENNRNTLYEVYTWNYDTSDWVGVRKSEYGYDTNGVQTMYAYYEWNSDNYAWKGNEKWECSYNDQGRQTSYIGYYWNWNNFDWYKGYEQNNSYDQWGDRLTYDLYDYYLDGTLYYSSHINYEYDTNSEASSIAGFSTWGYSHKLLKTTDADGNVVESFSYSPFTTATVNLSVNPGWNWVSAPFYMDLNEYVAAAGNVEYVASQTASLINDEEYGWFGNLSDFSPVKGYRLLSNNAESIATTFEGVENNQAVSLNSGWTWIGYNRTAPSSLASAIADACEGDVIKSKDAFAEFRDGTWNGGLETLTPGQGYIYFTNEGREMNYGEPENEVPLASARKTANSSVFKFNSGLYSDNMAVVARITDTDEQGRYVIGAFAGDECRGASCQKNGLHYLTVHGSNAGETIRFSVYDTKTGEQFDADMTVSFNGAVLGSVREPVLISGMTTAIVDVNSNENDNVIYNDLLGRKIPVVKDNGIYICNGKKVVK